MELRNAFEARYIPVTESGCWLWMGESQQQGYGRLRSGKSRVLAHRLSWELFRGRIDQGMFVCHKCDVPGCVNPNHLFLGSNSENMRDMYRKERRVRGGNFKLTVEQVRRVRKERNISCAQFAREFGVRRMAISDARNGKTFRQVETD